ncbi:MAG: putative RND superfamily exporter protein [Gammaproteobacteria bacterium]|jgi:predicted RND superfamily exporter protein
MSKPENAIARFITYMVMNPWKMILLSVVFLLTAGIGLRGLQFDNNYRVFFAGDNPDLAAFEKLEKVYTQTDNILFTIKPKTGDVFQPEVLKLVQELTYEGWRLPFAQRVDSITNFQHTYAEGDDLTVIDLVEKDPKSYSQEELDQRRQVALNEPTIVGKLLNRDGKTTGINVTVNMPRKDMMEIPETVAIARELVEKYRSKYPNIQIVPSGFVFLNNAFMESSLKDMVTLVPLMYLVLSVMMIVILRNWVATFGTMLVIMFSAIAAMGFGGWLGFPLTPPSASTPTIVLTLALADSIHIIISMFASMRTGMKKQDAILESLRVNLQPVFLTSLTTIIGFLSLNFSESPPFWHLGNMTAFGIGAAFFFSMVLLPAILTLLPIRIKLSEENEATPMDRLGRFITKRYKVFLITSIIIIAFLGSMMTRINVNDQFVKYFDESISFRPDTEFMMKNLSGIYAVEYSLRSNGASGISQPEYLNNLNEFTEWLRGQPEVDHVFSMSDVFKRLNMNMHADDKEWYNIPDNPEMAAQYLLLYEFSLPYGLDINDRVNIDKSATRVTVTLKDLSTKGIRAFKNRSETWLKENTPSYMHSLATSPAVMFTYISERNISGMMKGNLMSLLLISLVIMVALRSFRMGVISLISNITPIAIGYGLWGLFIQEINMAVAIAAAVSLGIIVDDTVHFLSKYLRARNEKGLGAKEAVEYAFRNVGLALFVTTVVLVFGFAILTQSGFQMNSHMGLLTAIVIGGALFVDFFFLPPLLVWLDKEK